MRDMYPQQPRRSLPESAKGKVARNPFTGGILSVTDLPPKDTKRWVIGRKALVIAAVDAQLLTLEEVYERYRVSEKEFSDWKKMVARHGVPGLRVTKDQMYRKVPQSAGKPA